jgi:hypothetical protein
LSRSPVKYANDILQIPSGFTREQHYHTFHCTNVSLNPSQKTRLGQNRQDIWCHESIISLPTSGFGRFVPVWQLLTAVRVSHTRETGPKELLLPRSRAIGGGRRSEWCGDDREPHWRHQSIGGQPRVFASEVVGPAPRNLYNNPRAPRSRLTKLAHRVGFIAPFCAQ